MFCKVAFAVPLRKLFDYSVPARLEQSLEPGMRVRAPFGKAVATGVAVELTGKTRLPLHIRLKEILSIEDPAPLFGGEGVGLAQYIAQRWCNPLGEVFGAMFPSWFKLLSFERLRAELEKDLNKPASPDGKRKTVSAAEKKPVADKAESRVVAVRQLVAQSDWTGTMFENAGAIQTGVPSVPEPPDHDTALDMEAMTAAFYDAPLGEPGSADGVPASGPDSFVFPAREAGPDRAGRAAVSAESAGAATQKVVVSAFTLTPDQRAACDALAPLVRAKQSQSTLLTGDSLTGKTEVFIRLMETALNCGRQVLYLLPDIALTQPFIEEFSARLGAARTVLWHSRLTPRQKNMIFNRLVAGESIVVAGTRSACLLPFVNLGLAVMDEEHDDSYKQEEQRPYYHAREVLVWRAAHHGCPVLFASSAPSMETLRFALDGRIAMLALNQPVRRITAPRVVITGKKGAESSYVSDELRESVASALARGQQSLLIINRLGYAAAYACLCCGWSLPCPRCGGGMGKQKTASGEFLKCGLCGTTAELPAVCPKCRDRIFRTIGSGTQRAILEL
ncbi:MAG: primosomal protein N', partial [Elusimicrobiaceae bacterium]|nr:primosomal protein N' [Elusimicrobiaceae bacterium]